MKTPANRRTEALPLSLPPFGVSRNQAAELVGVSASTFDKMVAAGRMPRPRVPSEGRVVYDVGEVADAFRRLPHQPSPGQEIDVDVAAAGGNPWDDA